MAGIRSNCCLYRMDVNVFHYKSLPDITRVFFASFKMELSGLFGNVSVARLATC